MSRPLLLLIFVLLLSACRPQPSTVAGPSGDGAILYADDFAPENTGKWELEGDERGQATIQEERLLIEIFEPNTVQYVTLAEQSFTNFALEVDATLVDGSTDSSFGVLFRMTAPDQFYRFDVTGNGLFVVERYDQGGGWTRLSEDWQASDELETGLGATNRLGVLAVAGTFSFYANGHLLLQLADGRYSGGNIALAAGTFSHSGTRVAFDNLVVRRP